MTRVDRYQLAVMLAQEILQHNPRHDELRIQQAIDDIIDEVRAGRRNQQEWPQIRADLEARGLFSVRVDEPHLRLVTEDQFDDLVREGVAGSNGLPLRLSPREVRDALEKLQDQVARLQGQVADLERRQRPRRQQAETRS